MRDTKINILFLGYVLPIEECIKNSYVHLAANRAQIGLLKGLASKHNANLNILTVFSESYFPRNKKIFYGIKKYLLEDIGETTRIPFFNIPIFKHITLLIYILLYGIGWSIKNRGVKKYIISYNMDAPIPQASLLLKLFHIEYVPFIFDLPIELEKNKSKIRNMLINKNRKSQKKLLYKLNKAIILNKNVAEDFNITKYIVVEGGLSANYKQKIQPKMFDGNKFNLFYSGSLTKHQGVDALIKAFQLLDEDKFTLTLCGRGELVEEIKLEFSKMKNAVYKGVVDDDELMSLQKGADLLLIPQPVNTKEVRYQFPSKIFEYFNSGTPVLSTLLPGLGVDFQKNMYVLENEDPVKFAKKIIQISKTIKREREKVGLAARVFIRTEKSWNKQCDRIINFLRD